MKALIAGFAAVAVFAGFSVTSSACGKDGKCVGKSSSACCMNKTAKAGCSTKASCSTKTASKAKTTEATVTKVADQSAK